MAKTAAETTTAMIRHELATCIAEARKQGWKGRDADYVYTAEDLESVVDSLCFKPTQAEWHSVDLGGVARRFIAESKS